MIKATVNQSIYEVKEGTTLSDLAKQVQLPQEPIILLAYMDGKLRELFTPMTKDCHVRFVTLKEQAGYMAYKRTATLMFLKACEDLLGTGATTKIALDYSIGNSIFCDFLEDRVIDELLHDSIQKRMEQLARANLPITKRSLRHRSGMQDILIVLALRARENCFSSAENQRQIFILWMDMIIIFTDIWHHRQGTFLHF